MRYPVFWPRPRRLALATGACLAIGTATVIACVSLVPQLLDDRKATLLATPANSFAYEMAHLVAPADALKADEGEPYDSKAVTQRNWLRERGTLDDKQFAQLKAMRDQADGDAAYAAGAGLPEAVRQYTAGAQDYRSAMSGQDSTVLLARARRRFEAVLALPPQQAASRAVWAAYMLGQWHAAGIVGAGQEAAEARRQANAYYERARQLALGGAPDPWALAVASYGEQARTWLVNDVQACDWTDFDANKPCADDVPLPDIKRAVALYAQQAARGSALAVDSLRVIAAWALQDEDRTTALIDDPLAQQVMVAYGLARLGDITDGDPNSASDYYVRGMEAGYADSARGDDKVKPNPALAHLVAAMQHHGAQHIAGADRVAALAYRVGRYAQAEALAKQQSSALAAWVRAKLALRRGDAAAAARAYAEAARAFPAMDASVEPSTQRLLLGEQGVLHLSQGQYVEALEQLRLAALDLQVRRDWGADTFPGYTDDASYVAERVLGIDELKTYVDARVRATPMPSQAAVEAAVKDATTQGRSQYPDARSSAARQLAPASFNDDLRQLLARRLMRAGRFDEALPYFPDDADPRFVVVKYADGDDQHPTDSWTLRASAREYGQASREAEHAWRAVTRAQAAYRAAQLARWRGMEIMGYEQAPDYHVYDGGLDCCSGPGVREPADARLAATPASRALAALPGPYVGDDERRRYAASEAQPNTRYHYRDIAVAHIQKAADALPARSQAFAAVLCQGAGMVFYDDAAGTLYRRYVKEGAYVPFAANFGRDCAEPDFAAAARFPYVRAWQQARHWLAGHRLAGTAALLAMVLAAAAAATAIRRRLRG